MPNTLAMEVFDGKKAAEDYMSKHTLAFSTPELTLMRFAFWLGDSVPDPKNKEGGRNSKNDDIFNRTRFSASSN